MEETRNRKCEGSASSAALYEETFPLFYSNKCSQELRGFFSALGIFSYQIVRSVETEYSRGIETRLSKD